MHPYLDSTEIDQVVDAINAELDQSPRRRAGAAGS
jgi:hypothetical protein